MNSSIYKLNAPQRLSAAGPRSRDWRASVSIGPQRHRSSFIRNAPPHGTLFDEYQSKENAKHVIRTMKENARQGFWNGATAPLGFKLVEAERRGTKVKKKLDIDPVEAETVRLIFELYSMATENPVPSASRRLSNG